MDLADVLVGEPQNIHFHWCGYFQSAEQWNHDERINPDFEMIIVTGGSLKLSFNEQKIIVSSGEMLLIPPYTHFVGFGDETGVDFYWLHFEAARLQLVNKNTYIKPAVKVWKIPIFSNGILLDNELFLIQQMQTIKQRVFSDTSLLDAYLYTLLLSISEKYQQPTYLNTDKHYLIDYIKKYLRWNYQRHIEIEEIANYFGYNKAYISNLFSRETGETITQYLSTLRLEAARQDLVTTNLSIREIANANGFEDEKYFSRVFSKKNQISPREYRKHYGRIEKM